MEANKTYERGKYPYTVLHTATNRLYVRKAVMKGGKQKQIWRVCLPPTLTRVNEILSEIEAEILSGNDKSNVELAKVFLKVQSREISFEEFKTIVKII